MVTHQTPPEGVCVGLELLFHLSSLRIHLRHILLNQVDQKRRQDERQEPDVPGGDELLGEQAADQGGGHREVPVGAGVRVTSWDQGQVTHLPWSPPPTP